DPTGINDAGQVVGSAYTSDMKQHAFLYSNGKMTDLYPLLSPFGGSNWSAATAINASGQVVGYSATTSNVGQTFLYSNGEMTVVKIDFGGTGFGAGASGINDFGQIVGGGSVYGNSFLYSGGKVTVLPGINPTGINNAGQVAGWVSTPNEHAVLYSG